MDLNQKFELVKRNTQEILTENELRELLKNKKITSYYGTAPTGPFHIAYLVPLSKLFDFDKAGIKNKILIANIHAALDDLKTGWDRIDVVADYYKKCIELAFPWDKKPEFVYGSSFELKDKYVLDILKLSTITTVARSTRAASEVTRMKNPKVSELIYPLMQALDEEYLNVDIQLGGIDQRHILAYAREFLPSIGYKQRVEVMTPLIASLKGPGTKMSASIKESHIKIYDKEEDIKSKIKNAYCPEGVIAENPVLQLAKFIVFPVNKKIKIARDKKYGGDVLFKEYNDLEKTFASKKLHPADLKMAVSSEVINIFSKARKYFEKNRDILKELGDNFIN